MAKIAAKNINVSVNSVSLEDEVSSITQNVEQETPEVAGLSSTGPERVVGNYDFSYDIDGFWDGASSQGDATLFAQIGASSVAMAFDPTGASAGSNDPNYDSSVVLSSYSISGAVGGAVTYSATEQGASALTWATL